MPLTDLFLVLGTTWQTAERRSREQAQAAQDAFQRVQYIQTSEAFQVAVTSCESAVRAAAKAASALQRALDQERLVLPQAIPAELLQQVTQVALALQSQAGQMSLLTQVISSVPANVDHATRAIGYVHAVGAALAQMMALLRQAQELRQEAQRKQRESMALSRARQAYLAQFGGIDPEAIMEGIRQGRHPRIVHSLHMHTGELALAALPVQLAEDRTTSRYVGASSGMSIPLGHGFRFRVGSYQGHAVRTEKLTPIDSGSLVVTTQRIVFTGARRSLAIPVAKIMNTVLYSDSIDIRTETATKREVFLCSNPRLLNTFVLIATQLLAGR